MKDLALLTWFIFFASITVLAQPYGGTIFVDPDIITAADSSTFESVSHTGSGVRTVFDRRTNDWETINAHLFEVVWNDGLTAEAIVNPEFDLEAAEAEAEIYGRAIGQLPTCLRRDVDEIWIHQGVELFGGGNRSILIHTGQSAIYQNDGILEETLVHEASHTSLDGDHATSDGWLTAQNLDGGFISDYAEEFPLREDIAESFLLWMAVRFRSDRISARDFELITQAIPNRLNYFDTITCDMFPIDAMVSPVTPIDEPSFPLKVYPNPTKDLVYIKKSSRLHDVTVILYSAIGKEIGVYQVTDDQPISLVDLAAGMYLLTIQSDQGVITKMIVKE